MPGASEAGLSTTYCSELSAAPSLKIIPESRSDIAPSALMLSDLPPPFASVPVAAVSVTPFAEEELPAAASGASETPFTVRPAAFVLPAAIPLVYTFVRSSPACASLPSAGMGT